MPVDHVNYREFIVLYVDDEPANLIAFRYAFEDQFRVLTAGGGVEALGLLASSSVAVLLADQRMPGMTGAELCARVRELHPDVVRMVVSAYADLNAALEAINSGQVSRYILKPWREEEMAAVLRTAIEAFHIGTLMRALQTRLLQSEQRAGAQLMIRSVLHELSNPVQALQANLRFVADIIGPPGGDPAIVPPGQLDDARAALADALEAGAQLKARIEYFRAGDAAMPRRGALATDIVRAVLSAVAIVRSEVQTRARLEVDVVQVAPVLIDTVQASQLLVNLLLNAKEAIRQGRPEENHITVRVRPTEQGALIEVEDSGCGIPEELLSQVFDPFVTTKDDKQGHGLGLAIVHEIVEAAGGRMSVKSQVNKGTTFSVELRAAAEAGLK